ncbi:MAG TPA: hypothetical protein VFM78_06670 [Marinobacter sp.]|nr:hypothetical protein [Marinobacter sp.]
MISTLLTLAQSALDFLVRIHGVTNGFARQGGRRLYLRGLVRYGYHGLRHIGDLLARLV